MKPFKIPKEEKEALISDLQAQLDADHGIEMGNLAAEQLIDYMIGQLSAPIYNQAVEDASKLLMERMGALEDDLYALKIMKKSRR